MLEVLKSQAFIAASHFPYESPEDVSKYKYAKDLPFSLHHSTRTRIYHQDDHFPGIQYTFCLGRSDLLLMLKSIIQARPRK